MTKATTVKTKSAYHTNVVNFYLSSLVNQTHLRYVCV